MKLIDVVEIRNGRNQRSVENPSGAYPIYGSGGEIGRADDYICEAGTVIIGRKGSINNPLFVNEPFWNVDTAFGLVANREVLLPKYLFYFCKAFDFESLNTTVTIPSLTKSNLQEIEIKLPSIATQQDIVRQLDDIWSLIELQHLRLGKLNQVVKSRFIEMFGDCIDNSKGWGLKRLEDIAAVGSSRRVFVEDLKDDGIPFFRGTEIGALAEGKSITPELFITEDHYLELCEVTGKPQVGDLLMPSICPDGRIWLVDTDLPFYFKDGRVLWVHSLNNQVNPVFLLYMLKNRIISDYSRIASGTTFAELKIFELKKCLVFDVPIALQEEFAGFVEQVDKSKLVNKKSLSELEELKNSLMQKYFFD